MEREKIAGIVQEERVKTIHLLDVLTNAQIRVSVEIASRIIRPMVSEEQWKLFLNFVKTEPYLHRAHVLASGPVIFLEALHFFEIYKTIERSYLLILDERDCIPDELKQGAEREEVVRGICALSVVREIECEKCDDNDVLPLSFEDANELVERIRYIQCVFADPVLVNEFVDEVGMAYRVIAECLNNS